ncbi:MAG: hypothetical protein Q4A60_06675 [Pasteurellaceae bacterium]|nr:hypothetical protein [Pasteurellaceae bacterium]
MTSEEDKRIALDRIGKSGFRGVRMSGNAKKPFRADFEKDGQYIYLGNFSAADEAARAYDKKVIEMFGESAMTNQALGLLDPPKTETQLSEHLLAIATQFCKYLEKRKTRSGKFLEFARAVGCRLSVNEVGQIIRFLEENDLATLSNASQQPNLIVVKFNRKVVSEFEKNHPIQKEPQMTNTNDLMNKSPEELEALAKQITALSEAKKEEIRNGDQIRKMLNPLILAVCQAKGKYDRLLEQQLDAMTELDNAVNALKEALKLSK